MILNVKQFLLHKEEKFIPEIVEMFLFFQKLYIKRKKIDRNLKEF